MNWSQFIVAASCAISATASTGAEIAIVCPSELPAEALKIVVAPKGWRPFISSPLHLHNAAPIAGPPERLGRMVGQTLKRRKGEWAVRYDDLDAPYPEGVWFSCDYGPGNEFSIAKKLDAGVKSCVVTGKKSDSAGPPGIAIKCE